MDFKKTTRYNEGRSRIAIPERGSQHAGQKNANTPGMSVANTREQRRSRPTAKNRFTRSIATTTAGARAFYRSNPGLVIGGVVLILACIVGAELIRQHNITRTYSAVDPNKIIENLEYQTVLPANKSITELGGWKRVSPPTGDPVYAYTDKIDGISVSISQQPLPKSFTDDLDTQLAELAKKFSATTKIDANGATVYVGTSAKGPQSAILSKNGLLILIKSTDKISDAAWAKYAKSLN